MFGASLPSTRTLEIQQSADASFWKMDEKNFAETDKKRTKIKKIFLLFLFVFLRKLNCSCICLSVDNVTHSVLQVCVYVADGSSLY